MPGRPADSEKEVLPWLDLTTDFPLFAFSASICDADEAAAFLVWPVVDEAIATMGGDGERS